uniref:Dolichyl-diphosphooligosaccharide--protein glycosyltransferase subunit 1 n=1 Tax=Eptatretus burgeri TaxID=7764 RepID=A0A8C4NB79_EPTBU
FLEGYKGIAYEVKLPTPLSSGEELKVIVEIAFTRTLSPFPTHIVQTERQLVVFQGNHYFYSPYSISTQLARVRLASKNVESFSKLDSTSKNEDVIEYGPFKDVQPFSSDTMRIHFENNSPFLTVTKLERVIEVSLWGNIAVEETVDLRHSGAVLKGPFSRYDYQRQPESGISSVRSFKTILPAAAQDVYYRDEIGNISTSNLLVMEDSVEMDVRPRFPLFGGWKTHYYIGYNLPSYEYLYNLVIDDLTVKIILPEGAKNIELQPPYPVHKSDQMLHFTYLDTFGRPVIIARKSNLVEQHIQDFVLHYTFNKALMLQEPLLVVAAFCILFLTVIIYVRLDFSITKDPAAETRMRVASLADQIRRLIVKRAALYEPFLEAVTRFKVNREGAVLTNARRHIDTEHRALSAEIAALLSRAKADGTDVTEKVTELQKMDAQMRDMVLKAATDADRLVHGKLGRNPYLENERQSSTRRRELAERIDSIVNLL